MADIRIMISGPDRHAVADRLASLADPEEQGQTISRSLASATAEPGRKAVDPISLAALVLSIPSALLAVSDLADRLRKRKKAVALIDDAKRVGAARETRVDVVLPDGTSVPLARLQADELLAIAAQGIPST